MTREIPQGIPQEVVGSAEYQSWKSAALRNLESDHPAPDQRFAKEDTSYDNPDRYPGVVRFRTEDGQPFQPGLEKEAQTVERSREYLLLGGEITALEERRTTIKGGEKDSYGKTIAEGLVDRAEEGWRGTEFDDLNGVGRVISAIPKTSAKITDPEAFREAAGLEFSRVAKRTITVEIDILEGHKMGRKVMTPEVIKEIIEAALEKNHISREEQGDLVHWGEVKLAIDLDVLRELIERDLILPSSVSISRSYAFRPDVLPKEKTPKPKDAEE